ncbi:hypothetical protein DBR32_09145 [Taibaiella sp. KBW10]|uniref:anti-sigma factor family protein n=1 Tax=Taibaiella sp. KBW10 TaxID=2153357 RepID=UPI000F5A525F|nr:hypothetical protein [Taibaiella sp. KBW10]RQO30872.1 hypothetical protein DBR32_09145 [Taibaiella sp. KBW10]
MKHTDITYIEEQIMLLVDGELNPEQEQAILEIIDTKEAYQQLYADYLSLKLDPQDHMVYAFKDELKKTIPLVAPVAAKKKWPLYAAAAIAPLVLLSSLWFFNQGQHTPEQTVAKSQLPPVFTNPIPTSRPTSTKPSGKTVKPQATTEPKKADRMVNKSKPNNTGLALQVPALPKEITAQHTNVPLIHTPQANKYDAIAIAGSPVNPIATQYVAIETIANEEDNTDFVRKYETPKGLLGNVINAGNWFFKEEKSTTIELSLGNKIHKSYTITLK